MDSRKRNVDGKRRVRIVRVAEARKVPRAVDKRVQRVAVLARAVAAALRARALPPLLNRLPRRLWKHRQRLGGHVAAVLAVYHRHRGAPPPLPRHEPIAQAEFSFGLAHAQPLELGRDGAPALAIRREPVEVRAVAQLALVVNHLLCRQPETGREGGVSNVVRRHAHDGPGAVAVDDKVGFDHGQQPTRHQRMRDERSWSQRRPSRVAGRQRHKSRAEERFGPRGERLERVPLGVHHGEAHQGSFGLANPVALHLRDAGWPAGAHWRLVQRGEQVVGKGANAHKPLFEHFLFRHCAGAPRAPVGVHLLVGQHGLVHGVPVDFRLGAVRQSCGVQLQKEVLGELKILGLVRLHGHVPIKRETQHVHLRPHACNVGVGPFGCGNVALSASRVSSAATKRLTWPRSRRAAQTRQSPSDAARRSPACDAREQSHLQWRTRAHGRGAAAQRGTGTCTARSAFPSSKARLAWRARALAMPPTISPRLVESRTAPATPARALVRAALLCSVVAPPPWRRGTAWL